MNGSIHLNIILVYNLFPFQVLLFMYSESADDSNKNKLLL